MDSRIFLTLVLLAVLYISTGCLAAGGTISPPVVTTSNTTATNTSSPVTTALAGGGDNGASDVWINGLLIMLSLSIALYIRDV